MQQHCDDCGHALGTGPRFCRYGMNNELISTICDVCDTSDRIADYLFTYDLSTHLLTRAAIAEYYDVDERLGAHVEQVFADIRTESALLQRWCKEFEKNVWFEGLQARSARSTRNFVIKVKHSKPKFEITVGYQAGRALVEFEDPKTRDRITLVTDEKSTEPVMGVLGVTGRADRLIRMIRVTIAAHRANKLLT